MRTLYHSTLKLQESRKNPVDRELRERGWGGEAEEDSAVEFAGTTIQRVHALLPEERDRLLDRIRESERNDEKAVADEAGLRAKGDDAVRTDALQLALGGLAQEAWATVLILIGIVVTTLAGVCSVV